MVKSDGNSPIIFDQARVRLAKQRAARMPGNYDFLEEEVSDRLLERIGEVNRDFRQILDFGHMSNLTHFFKDAKIQNQNATPTDHIEADTGHYDLILSNLMLHWINDLPGLLIQINHALKADGLFVASMFGGDTLTELRHSLITAEADITGGASARLSPFVDVRDAGGLLQRAGFALPVTDVDTVTVNYTHPLKLMQDLRGMGETNSLIDRPRKPLRRDVLARAIEIYFRDFALDDGRVPATFQIIYLTGWHPHESQQKPLKPGSGQVNLRDALSKK